MISKSYKLKKKHKEFPTTEAARQHVETRFKIWPTGKKFLKCLWHEDRRVDGYINFKRTSLYARLYTSGWMKAKWKIVLESSSGFWELDNFNPLLSFMERLSRNFRREFSGASLRTHGPAMRFMKNTTLSEVFRAVRLAGMELAESGEISPEIACHMSELLLQRHNYIAMINQGFEKILKDHGLL